MNILEVKKLNKSFGGTMAVKELSFVVKSGEITGLIGPNGAGKTTTFNLVCRSFPCDSGEIVFKGENISRLPSHAITSKGMARTFQGVKIFSNLTVLENVMTARHCHNNTTVWKALVNPRYVREQDRINREKALSVLEFLGLYDQKDRVAKNLAFAHQSLVSIANSLASDPELLLLDEPLAGMNPAEKEQLVEIIYKIRNSGVTVLIVEHNMKAIMSMCDRVVVLNFGEMLAEGKPQQIQTNQLVIDAYLGGKAHA